MLKIEILKQPDGTGVLRCKRQNGSITWQKQTKHAGHFALHDLTHYAVETCLGYQQGFFGLIAVGWDIEETTGKGARGPLPAETTEVEQIVGLFDSERASSLLWTCDEFKQYAPRPLTQAEIESVRTHRGTLIQQWDATPPGQKLELTFETELGTK